MRRDTSGRLQVAAVAALAATLLLAFAAAHSAGAEPVAAPTGSFSSSDPSLDAIWANSVQTASDMLASGGQKVDALGRPCPTPAGTTVILDGVVRDRCPYIGDESVIDLTYDYADPHWAIQRSMLALFAHGQKASGAIPSSPLDDGVVLFDYCGYWVTTLYNYVLYSGDVAFGRQMWSALVRLLERWYPSQTSPNGLLRNTGYPGMDYAYLRRRGNVVAYFNAQYVYVLKQAAALAGWLGHATYQARWAKRAHTVKRAFHVFWDPAKGAFHDTTADRVTHPQDGNAFAVVSGIATHDQAVSALTYLEQHDAYSYGNSIADIPTYDNAQWGFQSNLRVYPFMGYYELKARFRTGLDDTALDLIRREWGYMQRYGPSKTDWELIGPYGGGPTDLHLGGSWDAGWSSGAAPALSQYVLGVTPTSPGYATYIVRPHVGGLAWAKGDVVTPRGLLHVEWKKTPNGIVVSSKLLPPR